MGAAAHAAKRRGDAARVKIAEHGARRLRGDVTHSPPGAASVPGDLALGSAP